MKGGGKNYSDSEIKEIYSYVMIENKKYERMFDKSNDETYLDKIRDTSIFDKYNFINNTLANIFITHTELFF